MTTRVEGSAYRVMRGIKLATENAVPYLKETRAIIE
jgi:hypothetical protein